MTEALPITWDKGGGASIVAFDGLDLTVRSTIPSAPGSTLSGALAGHDASKVLLKVRSCKRDAEGRFVVAGRMVNLTRELREKVAAAALRTDAG